MVAIQALVGEQPGIGVLDDTADLAMASAMRLADLADDWLDAVTQAKPSVVGAIVSSVGVKPSDAGTVHHGQPEQDGEEPGIVNVRR